MVYGLVAVALPQFAYFSAVAHMQVAPALLIEFTAPAAVVVWLWLRHGERPSRLTLAGAGVAALGLVLVLDLLSGADLSLVGVLWSLVAMARLRDVLRDVGRREQRPAADRPGRRRDARRPRCRWPLLGLVGLLEMRATTASVDARRTRTVRLVGADRACSAW